MVIQGLHHFLYIVDQDGFPGSSKTPGRQPQNQDHTQQQSPYQVRP